MSTNVRKSLRAALPKVQVSVDRFQMVAKTNEMVNNIRHRRSHEKVWIRGWVAEPAYLYRKPPTCILDTSLPPANETVQEDPNFRHYLVVVYASKEHVRDLLKTTEINDTCPSVKASKFQEAKSLFGTLNRWRNGVLVVRRNQRRQQGRERHCEEPDKGRQLIYELLKMPVQILSSMGGLRPC